MTSGFIIGQLARDIRAIYAQAPGQAPERIEALLKEHLGGLPPDQARATVEQLMTRFPDEAVQDAEDCSVSEKQMLAKIFSMILGSDYSQQELTAGQMLERLALSLNTIFDVLNQLIGSINSTLSGDFDESENTIRQFIGVHMEDENNTQPLETYLGQINKAFLTTQQAMKQAVHNKMEQVLEAIDPEKTVAEQGRGLKFGPMRKAEAYEILKEKIEQIQRWFSSGRFMEDFLREFERSCQQFQKNN